MSEHFRAFSFVDRITALEHGARVRGRYAIPAHVGGFPASLVAEAIGQLAAWGAMEALSFQQRPVAGIAGRVVFSSEARPGQELSLTAELESLDAEAVAYHGAAEVNGTTLVRLEHCVGPMLPLAEFDDPHAVRDRFLLLCGAGATPGAFGGIPPLLLDRTAHEPGRVTKATLQVPETAALFADHFPRRPLLPGTLLMHLNLELAAALAAEVPPPGEGSRWTIHSLQDVKLRAFIAPGETVQLEAKHHSQAGDELHLAIETRRGKRMLGGARARFCAGSSS